MKRTAENQVKAAAVGGIEAVLKAINTHINNADVCTVECIALWNILTNNCKNINKVIQHNQTNGQLRTKLRQEEWEALKLL